MPNGVRTRGPVGPDHSHLNGTVPTGRPDPRVPPKGQQLGRSVGPCKKYGFLCFSTWDPGPREAPGWSPWAIRGPSRGLRKPKTFQSKKT